MIQKPCFDALFGRRIFTRKYYFDCVLSQATRSNIFESPIQPYSSTVFMLILVLF